MWQTVTDPEAFKEEVRTNRKKWQEHEYQQFIYYTISTYTCMQCQYFTFFSRPEQKQSDLNVKKSPQTLKFST